MDTSKSQVSALLSVARGLFLDLNAAYLGCLDSRKDNERLSRCVETRGLGFFTLDLPRFDSLLLAGLETGRLDPDFGFKTRNKGTKLPLFLEGLWLRVFTRDGRLCSDADVNAILFLRQFFCLGKKIEVMCSPARINLTKDTYYDIERTSRSSSLQWDSDELDCARASHLHFNDGLHGRGDLLHDLFGSSSTDGSRLSTLVGRMQQFCDILATTFGYYDPYSDTEWGAYPDKSAHKHGTGAVANLKGSGDKYSFPHWSRKLEGTFPYDAHGCYDFVGHQSYVNHEMPSKLICVPKTAKGPRLIASEPVEHQWCQQAIWSFLRRGCQDSWVGDFVDFKRQDLSQLMVVSASRDGSLCTIDLSNASDRLDCWAIERAWRRNPTLLSAFHAVRTRWSVDENHRGEKRYIKLRKFATSGSALTFPVQSLFFLAAAIACSDVAATERGIRSLRGTVRVFGDDIIVPTHWYADLRDLLQYLGLKVSDQKSFHLGKFRESCGSDAYNGSDVTPVKPRSLRSDTPESLAALVATSNNFFTKGFWHAAKAVESIDRDAFRRIPVAGLGSGSFSRASFVGVDYSHLKIRWNNHYQREEFRTLTVRSKIRRKPTGTTSDIFQYFTERPQADTKWSAGINGRAQMRKHLAWEPVTSLG